MVKAEIMVNANSLIGGLRKLLKLSIAFPKHSGYGVALSNNQRVNFL